MSPQLGEVVTSALAEVLDRGLPFKVIECESLRGPLFIQHAGDILELAGCSNLTELTVLASEVSNLSELRGLPTLTTLNVICSPVRGYETLTNCRNLETV